MNEDELKKVLFWRIDGKGFPKQVSGEDVLLETHEVVQIAGSFNYLIDTVRSSRVFPRIVAEQLFDPSGFHRLPSGKIIADQSVTDASEKSKARAIVVLKSKANETIGSAVTEAPTPRNLLARLQEQALKAKIEVGYCQQVIRDEIVPGMPSLQNNVTRTDSRDETTPMDLLVMAKTYGNVVELGANEVLRTRASFFEVMSR